MTPADAELRKAIDTMRIWISEDAHLGESTISYELERTEGLRKLDAIEQAIAATVGRRDTMELWPEWEQVLFANVTDEVAQDNLNECVHELLDKAATVGRSCASCPEMDNPDSYVSHLHRALEWHDEHVPRPTNPHATVVVLRGTRLPDEVLFVMEDGSGVKHYLPESVCS